MLGICMCACGCVGGSDLMYGAEADRITVVIIFVPSIL